jgi:GNAT superfamily N-acetyltransferase
MADTLARGHYVRLAFSEDDSALGFVEASKRVDYVNGTSSSPVVFMEGLYVEPAVQRMGIARALVAGVEQWARAECCTELASDSLLENVVAHAALRALGSRKWSASFIFAARCKEPAPCSRPRATAELFALKSRADRAA